MLGGLGLAALLFIGWLVLEYHEFKAGQRADRAESERLTKRWLEERGRNESKQAGDL